MEGRTAAIHIGHAARESKLRQSRGEFSVSRQRAGGFPSLLALRYESLRFDSLRRGERWRIEHWCFDRDGPRSGTSSIARRENAGWFFSTARKLTKISQTRTAFTAVVILRRTCRDQKMKFGAACCWTWWVTAPSRSRFHRIRRRK